MMKFFIVFVSILPAVLNVFGQDTAPALTVVWQKEVSSKYVLTGSLSPLHDTSVVLTASGGLMLLNPDYWIPPSDRQSLLISAYYSTDFTFNLISNYNPSAHQSYLLWHEPKVANHTGDTILVLDSMMCFIEGGEGIIFVYGQKNTRHFIYQLTLDGLIEIFSSAIPPGQIQILDQNSFFVSYFDKILYCQRGATPYIFYQMPGQKEILGFHQTPENRFYISNEDGIFALSQGKLILQYAGAKGILRYHDQRIYVLDTVSNKITILRGA